MIESWRAHGYIIHVMSDVAWGQYQDYLNGGFDGAATGTKPRWIARAN